MRPYSLRLFKSILVFCTQLFMVYYSGIDFSLRICMYIFHMNVSKYIWCIKGSHRPDCTATFYNTDWERQPFSFGYPLDIYPAPRPEKLDEMLELTKILCKDFEHVRVDWYIMPDGRILFGEMTFQTWGGMKKIVPKKYDLYLGSLI